MREPLFYGLKGPELAGHPASRASYTVDCIRFLWKYRQRVQNQVHREWWSPRHLFMVHRWVCKVIFLEGYACLASFFPNENCPKPFGGENFVRSVCPHRFLWGVRGNSRWNP